MVNKNSRCAKCASHCSCTTCPFCCYYLGRKFSSSRVSFRFFFFSFSFSYYYYYLFPSFSPSFLPFPLLFFTNKRYIAQVTSEEYNVTFTGNVSDGRQVVAKELLPVSQYLKIIFLKIIITTLTPLVRTWL